MDDRASRHQRYCERTAVPGGGRGRFPKGSEGRAMTSAAITPNTTAAITFLKFVYPQGPWVLTSIRPDRKAMETETFHPASEDSMKAWLAARNGEHNIYW